MNNMSKEGLKNLINEQLSKNKKIIVFSLSIIGFLLYAFSYGKNDFFYPLIGLFGSFLFVSITVSFIYSVFLKDTERQLFIDDMKSLLKKELSYHLSTEYGIKQKGRLSLDEKLELINQAKYEVIEFGLALHTFSGYFKQRSSFEFKSHIDKLIKKGIIFKFILLDPESKIAKIYSQERNEANLIKKIEKSIEILKGIQQEYRTKKYKGKFEIYVYSQVPSCTITIIDPEKMTSKAYYSHYLFNILRAECPVIKVSNEKHSELLEKYTTFVNSILLSETTKKLN